MDDRDRGRVIAGLALLLSSAALCAAASAAEDAQNMNASFEAHEIRRWQANGTQGIWMEVADGRWLYATFLQPCAELPSSVSARFRWSLSDDLQVGASVMTAGGAVCAVRRVDEVKGAGSTTPLDGPRPDPELEGVLVQGGPPDSEDADVPRCGVRSIVWALTRPGSAWRLIAPVENTAAAAACIRSSAPGYRWSPGVTP